MKHEACQTGYAFLKLHIRLTCFLHICAAVPLEWPIAAGFEEPLPEGAGPEVAQIIWNETLGAHDDANATQRRSCISMRSLSQAACPLRAPDSFSTCSALQREVAVGAA
jgi:hypothetical protein